MSAVPIEIFVSHTHSDAPIADVLNQSVENLFRGEVTTSYSTNKELVGGIRPGEDWFRWIVDRVKSARVAVILLTPASIQKPWVLWEAGAVYGAAIALAAANQRKVRPLTFKLSASQIPSPFGGIQSTDGEDRAGIELFLLDLIETFKPDLSDHVAVGRRLDGTVAAYLKAIEPLLDQAPVLATEAGVQEWCDRLDKLAAENRWSEVEYLHDWLNLAFGRGRGRDSLPIDVRIHRRLGEAYRAANQPDRAAQQFALALEFAPRDIFTLRYLGMAYLDADKVEPAARVVGEIARLDPGAFVHNVECATLRARLERKRGNLEGAAEIYRRAWESNRSSYYLADNLGQMLLQLGRRGEARQVYAEADAIIEGLRERNIWTYATQATAALTREDEASALEHLREIAKRRPNPDDVQRIATGLDRVRAGMGYDAGAGARWLAAMGDGHSP